MKKLIRCGATAVLIAASSAWASPAAAADLTLTINNGRATLIAQDVPLRQILAEWERVGRTTIVNGDKMSGPAVTLQLVDRPEREVLEVILRSASGYVVANRAAQLPGTSMFDRVMILATSRAPAGNVAGLPAAFNNNRPNMPQPMPMPTPMTEEDDEPVEGPVPPPGALPMNNQPGMPQNPNQSGNPGQLTAPRPGMLPAPPASQTNPYSMPPGTYPGGVRPPTRPPGGGSGGS